MITLVADCLLDIYRRAARQLESLLQSFKTFVTPCRLARRNKGGCVELPLAADKEQLLSLLSFCGLQNQIL